jgi:hypothetical protein
MPTQLSDTDPGVEKLQISLIRRASIATRISRTRSLSRTVIQLSRRAISRAHPGLCEEELGLAFVAYHYGEKLADSLRGYLNKKHNEIS